MTEVLRRYRFILIAVLMILFILLIWVFGRQSTNKIPTRGVFVESASCDFNKVGRC